MLFRVSLEIIINLTYFRNNNFRLLASFVFRWPLVMLSGRGSTESVKRRKTKRIPGKGSKAKKRFICSI